MSELKAALKESKQLLSTGEDENSQKAIDLLQPFIDRDVEDYFLYCFGALANANLEEYEEAQDLYEKGIKLDQTKPQAWLGLFKLYDAEDIDLGRRGLDVCEKVLEIGDDDKKQAATELKRRIFLKLNEYDKLLSDLGDHPQLMMDIIKKVEPKLKPTPVELQIMSEAYERLSPNLPENPTYWLKYCKYLFNNGKPYREQILGYIAKEENNSEWVYTRLLEFMAEDYFVNSTAKNDTIWNYISKNEEFDSKMEIIYNFLEILREDNVTGALEIMDKLSYPQTITYPACLIVSRLLVEVENWEQLIKVLNAFPKRSYIPEEVNRTRDWLLVRAYLEKDGSVPDNMLIDKCCSAEYVPPEFYKERIVIQESSQCTSDKWKEDVTEFNGLRIKFLEMFLSKTYNEAAEEGTSLIESDQALWTDLLNVAEARYFSGQDSVALLVKVAKLAPRSSRVFYLLGLALQKKNVPKAKSCLERAVKLQPSRVEYVKALDEIFAVSNEDPKTRLLYLKPLLNKGKEKWVRETVAKLAVESGDYETAINELQKLLRESPQEIGIWARLADVYARQGHFASAINAYEQILELHPKTDHYISLIGLLIRMRRDDEALEKAEQFRELGSDNAEAFLFLDILESLAHLRLGLLKYGEEKMEHIRKSLALITPVVNKQLQYPLPYKLAGDLLLQIYRYNPKYLPTFNVDPSWEVTATNILSKTIDYYVHALQLDKNDIAAYIDLAISLLLESRHSKDPQNANNAAEIVKKALLSTDASATKSVLWNLLGESRRLTNQSPASQQHCYIRALELNKANDEAWLRLAVLYMTNGKKKEASVAFETALKYNPQLAEAWCGWAIHADEAGERSEAEAMYRQCLTLKPLPTAVIRFTSFACEDIIKSKTNFDTSSVLKDFPEIFDIYYSSYSENSTLLTHLGILAELFGHYQEAIECHKDAGTSETDPNFQRVLLKAGMKLKEKTELNSNWTALVDKSSEELFEIIKQDPIYKDVFRLLQEDGESSNELKEMFVKHRKYISMPLVISAIIAFHIKISDSAVQVLHDVFPRHELIDVFPTVLPEGLDSQLQYLEQDGEVPFRYKHHIAKPLFEELKKRREALEEST